MSDELIKELSRLQLLSSRCKNKMSMCPLSITLEENRAYLIFNYIKELKAEKQEWINLLDMFKNQQKEFIKYLEEEISKWHYNYDSNNYEYEIEEPTAEELLQTSLSKYQEITGQQDGQVSGQVSGQV